MLYDSRKLIQKGYRAGTENIIVTVAGSVQDRRPIVSGGSASGGGGDELQS